MPESLAHLARVGCEGRFVWKFCRERTFHCSAQNGKLEPELAEYSISHEYLLTAG